MLENRIGSVLNIIKWVLVSYLITICIFAVFALILVNTDFPEKYMAAVIIISIFVSIVVTGSLSSRHVTRNGWLNGAIVGFMYMLVIYMGGSIALNNFMITTKALMWAVLAVFIGAISGVIGINIKSSVHN